MLVPDNRSHEPIHFNGGWRVIGKVLWWLGLPPRAQRLGKEDLKIENKRPQRR